MAVRCPHCGLRTIRRSQIRVMDVPRLLLLRYPMRCRTCRARFYITIFALVRLRKEARARRAARNSTSKAAFD